MGRYTQPSDLYGNQIYRLDASIASTSTVEYWITKAEAEIDGYLSKQYSMPIVATSLTSVPPLVASLAQDLSAFKILTWQYSGDNQNVSEWVTDIGANAYKMLEDIAKDNIRITTSAGTVMEPFIGMSTNLEDVPLVMNMDNELNWETPLNLLESIYDGRIYAG
jgi:phage gp36-like protein